MNTLLSGVVGSSAYGLATEDSDVDRLGMYAVNTVRLHGLHLPTMSQVTTDPDVTLHEAGKFVRLALGGNPTVTELMWLEGYETLTPLGEELIGIRSAFLSADRVRGAYLGYATQQFKKLESRGDGTFGPDLAKRTAKHARHMYRLLEQGLGLWCTGSLQIRVAHPVQVMSFGDRVAAGDVGAAYTLLGDYEDAFSGARTVLPDAPDEQAVESWLLKVRATFYTQPA